jgi:hypothetical protein
MQTLAWLVVGIGTMVVVAAVGCGDDDSGSRLTVASGATVGNGGQGGNGDGGATTSANGGAGGGGGGGEDSIHGCTANAAVDHTGMATLDITHVGNNLPERCIRVSVGTTITVDGTGAAPNYLIVGGTFDGQVKNYDQGSPIQPACYDCDGFAPACFNPNCQDSAIGKCPGGISCYAAASWTFAAAGVFPFYDNADPETDRGVVYVVP